MFRTRNFPPLVLIGTLFFCTDRFACGQSADAAPDPAQQKQLALEAQRIFSERCQSCHNGVKREGGRLNVLDHSLLTETVSGETYETYIVKEDLKNSGIWNRVAVLKDMPPKGGPLTEAEISAIRNWIEQGAPSWDSAREIKFITEQDQLRDIRNYLTEVDLRTVPQLRFFSLANIYNDPSYSERDLNLFRAALSKAVNAMSRAGTIFVPKSINETKTLFAINIADLGWGDDWSDVIKAYPYGLKPIQTPANPDSRKYYDAISSLYTSAEAEFDDVAIIRADWFIARATRPPLYHKLAGIPDSPAVFFREQGVTDFSRSYRDGTLKRAGMFKSGVSSQNRLVEVHRDGRVWMSYDFKKNDQESNLSLRPLGPKGIPGNPFEQFAFNHDGGEVIFQRDNGLHGYMLIGVKDGSGVRINEGPVEIVYDVSQVSGSPLIVNGLSCMACHKSGLKPLDDDIRDGHSLTANNKAADQVRLLYPPKEQMDAMIRKANDRFQDALRETIGGFFEEGQDLMKLPEPIGFVAQNFEHNVTLQRAAIELGMIEPKELEVQVRGKAVNQFGLAPLQGGGSIKRGFWETRDNIGASVFQQVSSLLGVGTPAN